MPQFASDLLIPHDSENPDRAGYTVWRKARRAGSTWRCLSGPRTNSEDAARQRYTSELRKMQHAGTRGTGATVVLVAPNGRIMEKHTDQ